MALQTNEINQLIKLYTTYGSVFTELVTGRTRKTICTYAKLHGAKNASKEDVNKILVDLIKKHEGIL